MTIIQKENKVKKYFTLPIEFVKHHQLMRNSFTYQKNHKQSKDRSNTMWKLLINLYILKPYKTLST